MQPGTGAAQLHHDLAHAVAEQVGHGRTQQFEFVGGADQHVDAVEHAADQLAGGVGRPQQRAVVDVEDDGRPQVPSAAGAGQGGSRRSLTQSRGDAREHHHLRRGGLEQGHHRFLQQ
ncbi:Uncharacterised protein [Mycobacteroides abscessus subsp. abscessus]|nr:Uncharacterised protein [Mycobacteroides abscessus subsp. abscessus]